MNQVLAMPRESNSLSRRCAPTSPAKKPRETSHTERSPP
jgi:hypothetical protein